MINLPEVKQFIRSALQNPLLLPQDVCVREGVQQRINEWFGYDCGIILITTTDALESWPEFSGDNTYPIKCPLGGEAGDCFHSTPTRRLWAGAQGQARFQLSRHLATQPIGSVDAGGLTFMYIGGADD